MIELLSEKFFDTCSVCENVDRGLLTSQRKNLASYNAIDAISVMVGVCMKCSFLSHSISLSLSLSTVTNGIGAYLAALSHADFLP